MARAKKTPFEEEITDRPSRAKDTTEFSGGRPQCPRHLSKPAKAEWRRCVKLLEQRKACTPGDYAVLALYATTYARWLQALAEMDGQLMVEVTVADSHGVPRVKRKVHPLLPVAQACERELKSLAAQMGLTPVSRARVAPTTPVKPEYEPGTIGYMLAHGDADGN